MISVYFSTKNDSLGGTAKIALGITEDILQDPERLKEIVKIAFPSCSSRLD